MRKIFISGAGGFIGARLVEILSLQGDWEISVLLRNLSKGARIARFPLKFSKGDVSEISALENATKGCEIIVHCAHDFVMPEKNLKAAEALSKLALQNKVKRFVYISSFAVHNNGDVGIIDEDSEFNKSWVYARNKLTIENLLLKDFKEKGLPVIIVRPTIVYGPFSTAWTINTVLTMAEGRIMLPFMGDRICNAVYIDDVIKAITSAININDSNNGKVFLISGPGHITWKDFYNAFTTLPSLNKPVLMNEDDSVEWLKKLNSLGNENRASYSLRKDPVTYLKKTLIYTVYLRLLKNQLLQKKILSVKTFIPRPLVHPTKESFDVMSCKVTVSVKKIETEMNVKPSVTFTEGMEKTKQWIQWANILNSQ